MALPFKLNPEPTKRPDEADPFLEFDSERPGVRPKMPVHEPLFRPEPDVRAEQLDFHITEPTLGLGQPKRTSAISPAFAFAIGVAGLVTAAVAYYQLSLVLSSRPASPQAESTPTAASPESPAPAGTSSAKSGAPPPLRAQAPPARPAAPAGTGRIDVVSNPPGALVSHNGVARGLTPFILTGLPAGRHTIVISRGSFSATRTIELGPGAAQAVSVAIPYSVVQSSPTPRVPNSNVASASATGGDSGPSGWLTFDLPVTLQVFQGGRLRGSTKDARVPVAAGTHNVVLANEDYEYRETVALTVAAGEVTHANVSLPTGYLSLNALPWADVWVDGNEVGTTPLANLSLPIGTHEVLWKHPTLGERRQVVIVKAKTPGRAGVDFTR